MNNAEQLLATTVYLEACEGEESFSGTGFFCQFPMLNGRKVVALVSCRHLLESAKTIKFWIRLQAGGLPTDESYEIVMNLNGQAICHPDKEIDLAAVIIHHIDKHVEEQTGRKPFYRALSLEHIPKGLVWNDIYPGDDVLIIGCPGSLRDDFDSTPFIRRGTIANFSRHPNQRAFYVDAPIIAGSSGSPIILDSHISYDKVNPGYHLRSRSYFVGVITVSLEDDDADFHMGKAIKSDAVIELMSSLLMSYGLQ